MAPTTGQGLPRAAAVVVAALLLLAAVEAAAVADPRGPGATASTPVSRTSPGLLASKQCCATGLVKKQHKLCSDGAKINLDCAIILLLDKEENADDAYSVRPDGTLLIGNESIHDYCLTRMQLGESDPPHEVAFLCHTQVPGEGPDDLDRRPQWWYDVASTLSWLSVACLVLTLAAHGLLPELRDLQGRCHMGAVASLAVGLFVLALLQTNTFSHGSGCTTMAFLVYYWLLSAFFWLNVTAFNVWRSVVLEHIRFRERTLFVCYCAVGWGVPFAVLLLLLAAHLVPEGPDGDIVRPGFGQSKCWFQDDRATWAWFYWPLAVLLGMNVVYFVWTTAHLWRQYGSTATSSCRRKLMRRRFLLSLKLFLIMGISWIFELISSAADVPGHAAWYLTDTFNAMQGVVILLVLVVMRRRAWRALYRRRPCGLRPPEHWGYPASMRDRDDGCVTGTDTEDEDETECAPRTHHQELKEMTAVANGANGHKTNGVH